MKKKIAKIEVKPIYQEVEGNAIVGDSKPKKCDLCGGLGYIHLIKGGEVKTCQECLKLGRLNQQ